MLKVAIIIGSTRPNRKGAAVARWVLDKAQIGKAASFELVDIGDYNLPLLDEPESPSRGRYAMEHTKRWSEKIAGFDAYIFVTPEYNHGIPGALKNAIDFLYKEWNNKAAGFVSYGGAGGVRAVESLRLVMGELQVADVRNQVTFTLASDFKDGEFSPDAKKEKSLQSMLDQLVAWADALAPLRADQSSR